MEGHKVPGWGSAHKGFAEKGPAPESGFVRGSALEADPVSLSLLDLRFEEKSPLDLQRTPLFPPTQGWKRGQESGRGVQKRGRGKQEEVKCEQESGRGEQERGRGEHERGRGEQERGRWEQERERGEQEGRRAGDRGHEAREVTPGPVLVVLSSGGTPSRHLVYRWDTTTWLLTTPRAFTLGACPSPETAMAAPPSPAPPEPEAATKAPPSSAPPESEAQGKGPHVASFAFLPTPGPSLGASNGTGTGASSVGQLKLLGLQVCSRSSTSDLSGKGGGEGQRVRHDMNGKGGGERQRVRQAMRGDEGPRKHTRRGYTGVGCTGGGCTLWGQFWVVTLDLDSFAGGPSPPPGAEQKAELRAEPLTSESASGPLTGSPRTAEVDSCAGGPSPPRGPRQKPEFGPETLESGSGSGAVTGSPLTAEVDSLGGVPTKPLGPNKLEKTEAYWNQSEQATEATESEPSGALFRNSAEGAVSSPEPVGPGFCISGAQGIVSASVAASHSPEAPAPSTPPGVQGQSLPCYPVQVPRGHSPFFSSCGHVCISGCLTLPGSAR